jgi:hypothetical protein
MSHMKHVTHVECHISPQVFSVANTTSPVYSLFTPGSMFGVGITEASSHGVVVVAAGKHVHANVMVLSFAHGS